MDDTNSWCSNTTQVAEIIVWFYTRLFTSERIANINGILDVIQPLITEDMNTSLTKVFTKQDVDIALKEMAPLKAPGLTVCPLYFSSLSGT